MRRLKYFLGLGVLVAILCLNIGKIRALDVPPVPTDVPIVDQTNTLNDQQKQALATTIAQERAKSSNQIGVLIIPTLDGDSLEDYSLRVGRQWGIGDKSKNNGVLLLIVKNDRKLRIEVGYGLEGALTDARSSQIIRNDITPQFKQGNYYEGITNGVNSIIASIHNEYVASTSDLPKANGFDPFVIIYALIFIPLWLSSILARSKSWWAGGLIGGIIGGIAAVFISIAILKILVVILMLAIGLVLDFLVSRNYKQRASSGLSPSWWAGGSRIGGGGGSSGGFGGFSGGSFGGGGSSGSW